MSSLRTFVVAVGVLAALAAAGCKHDDTESKVDGALLFKQSCARCHGPEGHPDPSMVAKLGVKDLTQPALQTRMSDADIRHQILNGSKNKQMPSFTGALTDKEITAVIAHVRTLRRDPAARR